jgi:hypothetical protein
MSNFKIKHDKTTNDSHVNTLDETHKKLMKTFQMKKDSIPSKKRELLDLKKKLGSYDNPKLCDDIDNLPKIKSDLKTKIKALESEIYDIENDDAEFDYYYKINGTIMDYYDLLNKDDDVKYYETKSDTITTNENKRKDQTMDALDKLNLLNKEKNKSKKVTKRKNKNVNTDPQINILNFFIKEENEVEIPINTKISKSNLLDQYMSLTDSRYMCSKNKEKSKSRICGKCMVEKILVISESIYVCQTCGSCEKIIIDCDKTVNKETASDNKSGYPYKKINHLNEWLSQFQAKESINIPQEVYDNILAELHKNKIYDYSDLKLSFMKSNILKTLGYEIYYEHTVYIVSNLSGIQPPIINKETEDKIRLMFRQIQIPFNKYIPKDRVNFLSYSYVLHKIFQLLELDDFLKYFPLLKSRDKLILQDELWQKICYDLNWEYYPSV